MKQIIKFLVVILFTTFFFYQINNKIKNKETLTNETRGVFISYIEYMDYFKEKNVTEIESKINNIIKEVKNNNLNTIYLHVRPFSDSIYKSSIFPYSHTISGTQGKEIELDVLEYFIRLAHKNDIKVHAWINPYRISNNTDASFLSEYNPAYKWLNTNNVKIIEDKGVYYNPASKEVKELIINGVLEIVNNYEVDGILFDDYFYPDNTIDLENYEEVKDTISLQDFRLSQVNELINNIYKKIKEINKNILFGISPDGNINNNYEKHYADIKKWLSNYEYVDYIMPQLYYGFTHETKPFIETINEWSRLILNDTKLIPALALYKSGNIDKYAGIGENEWIETSNIIKKQIQVSRNIKNYNGFVLFRYDNIVNLSKNVNLQTEINEFNELFNKK